MTRINTPSGWGTILDPETDERVAVDEDLDDEVAERLADEYGRVEIADDSDESEDEDTPDDRAVDLADKGYQDAVGTIESGEADDYLDDLEDADDRVTIQEAIEDRRDELEE